MIRMRCICCLLPIGGKESLLVGFFVMKRRKWIEKKLNAGISILMDRYSFSGAAYSTSLGLDPQWCWQSEIGLPAPDAVLFLDISPESAMQRKGYGAEVYEMLDFQIKVREAFANLLKFSFCKIVNAEGTPDQVWENVKTIGEETLKQVKNPIAYF